MRKLSKKWKLWGLFLILMFFAAGATVHTTVTDVQAATKNGFKTEGGKSYYYKNGKKVKGLVRATICDGKIAYLESSREAYRPKTQEN